MKILQINSVCGYGSTGNICTNIYDLLIEQGHECCIGYGRYKAPDRYKTIKIGNRLDNYIHVLLTRLFDLHGFCSKAATRELVNKIKIYDPDIIHLHNIHGYYINIEILFRYLKESKKKVVWTLHDCWGFTGHCASFLSEKCYRWKKGCYKCPLHNEYPKSYLDRSMRNWNRKKRVFLELGDQLTIVPVSNWLSNQVDQSILSTYNRVVIPSGIDTDIFKPVKTDFKKKYKIENKKVILGVSNVWNTMKGFEDFIELSEYLDDTFVIVLVGLSKNQMNMLPNNMIGIERTSNQSQLAEIYSSADIFVNFSKAETFGLTNLEAQACGTTVISFDAGGTMETLISSYAHMVRNVEDAYLFITNYDYAKKNVVMGSQYFDKRKAFEKYIALYDDLLK